MINDRLAWQQHRILLAIPIYNEAKFIGNLLQRLKPIVPWENLVIIDDGSTDNSQQVIENFKVPYLRNNTNCGKGYSLLRAIAFAKKHAFRWLITMDGDGQHDPRQLTQFLQAIREDKADIILGNRQKTKGNMPWIRRLSNGITSMMISLLIGGLRIHDSQCGYRALRLAKINIHDYRENGFQFESELLLQLGKKAKISEIPIGTYYGFEKSKIKGLSDTLKFVRLMMRYLWRYA